MDGWLGDEPTSHVGGGNVFGGAGGAEAVLGSESGNTVSVLTVGGHVVAECPREWGQPQTVGFYDTSGNLLVRLDFETG